ncbi:glycosyltransferase [Echinicola vietnamensis]|uniref:Glycosyl transferase n=1 Tax=Echinicola vietnamensis (strain DSM 17526 / LMG 23754 / KMM 6221) TaxID=926556 RepID=L0G6W0_ECHVK|nr:glycosyltransferase [Echinicola vietnamensis]AGA80746.1 glycosyl transferase [Echinicola vietnamensis DSM 17526]
MNSVPKEHYQKYAIVVSCYNEEGVFPFHHFLTFARMNPGVLLCFIDDGSTDKTFKLLRRIKIESSENVIIIHKKVKEGKANALRDGMLHVYEHYPVVFLGCLDSCLDFSPEGWLQMVHKKAAERDTEVIIGKRKDLSSISSKEKRLFMYKVGSKFIYRAFGVQMAELFRMSLVFHRNIIPSIFGKRFLSSAWYEIEMILRLQQKLGGEFMNVGKTEIPTSHNSGNMRCQSGFSAPIKASFQFLKLYYNYRMAPNLTLLWAC